MPKKNISTTSEILPTSASLPKRVPARIGLAFQGFGLSL
jgi:hypothetical protein